jgi:hypothetical protein
MGSHASAVYRYSTVVDFVAVATTEENSVEFPMKFLPIGLLVSPVGPGSMPASI